MKTPEGSVKDEIKKYLDSFGARLYYQMPVQGGYGKRQLDFTICFKGMFIAIEAKRKSGYAKKFQLDLVETIRDAHGHAIVADCVEDVEKVISYIDKSF